MDEMNRGKSDMEVATRFWLAPANRMRKPGLRDMKPRQTPNTANDTLMKPHALIITFLSAAVFAVGCKKEETTSQQLDKVKTETKEAAQDMKDYSYAQKAEFTEKMKSQLDEINRDLDQLAAKIEKSNDAVKAEAKPKLQALREQTAQLEKQLDEVKNATESTWDTVKSGTKKAYDALKEGFHQSRQWVSDKIAP
jgi:hypothetical protein